MRPQAYEVVIAEIESLIRSGEIGVGDRLEGERTLAERLGVSRTSVREAIRILGVLGIIRSAPGSGPNAGAQIVARPEAPLTTTLRLHIAAESFGVVDVVESRVMLESWAYRRVTAPLNDKLDGARSCIDQMDIATDAVDFLRLDAEFHLELVRLAGNPLLTSFMASLRASIADYTVEALPRIDDWPTTARRLQDDHRAIVEALATGDGSKAADLAEEHIWSYARLTGLS